MAVDFDAHNRAIAYAEARKEVRRDTDNGRMGMSPSEYLAFRNNETFKSNNGSYPERPYSPYGTYSTGR